MSIVIDVHNADDKRDVVHQAVQALAEGKLVAMPTETVYGVAASALSADGVKRLCDLKQRQDGQPFSLAVKSPEAIWDYSPSLPPVAERLARRCWPGPLTMILPPAEPQSALFQLPESVQEVVSLDSRVGLRVPGHDLVLSILSLAAGPIVLTSANEKGHPEATDGQQVIEQLGGQIDLILDDGRCKFGQTSSVVDVTSDGVNVLRPGVISENNIRRFASYVVLVVCTGNTCRSPMAEVLLKKQLADKFGCSIEALEDTGISVLSSGVAAAAGGRSTPEAVDAVKLRGLDLSGHESQPLTSRLVRIADLILTMTNAHRHAVVSQWPEAATRTFMVSRDYHDVADPIGGSPGLYQQCADQIDEFLKPWVPDVDLSGIPKSPSNDTSES